MRKPFLVAIFLSFWCEVQANNVVLSAYNQAVSQQNTDSALADEDYAQSISTEQYMEFVVHVDTAESAIISEKSNLIRDMAILLNVKSVSYFESFNEVPEDVRNKLYSICPDILVDCDFLDLTYRRIDNFCNNEDNPRWGNPKIAQLRLAPALWERTILIAIRLWPVFTLRPLGPIGGWLFPKGNPEPYIFHLEGNTGFMLAILRQQDNCGKIECKSDIGSPGTCEVNGIIHELNLLEQSSETLCEKDDTFSFVGNIVRVTRGCSGIFEVCFQPLAASVNIARLKGQTSYIKLYDEKGSNGEVVAKHSNAQIMFPALGESFRGTFSLNFIGGFIVLCRGCECDKNSVILEAELDKSVFRSLLSGRKKEWYALAGGGFDITGARTSFINIKIPVRDLLQLETRSSDQFSGYKSLDDSPFLYQSGSLRFGISQKSVVNLDLIQTEGNTVTLTLSPRADGSNIEVFDAEGNSLNLPVEVLKQQEVKDDFQDGDGNTVAGFRPYWTTWIDKNLISVGVGNVVGKNTFMYMKLDFDLVVDRVIPRSILYVLWIFDIVQWGVPRKTSYSGNPLPSARDVSLGVHSNIGLTTDWSDVSTMAVMQMGQFLDHDIIATPTESIHGEEPIACCVDGQPVAAADHSRFCLDIEVTTKTDANGNQGAFPHTNTSCLPFVRSATIIECDATTGNLLNREPMNVLTSFVDASNVYGSEPNEAEELRDLNDHTGAYLRMDGNGNELPQTTEEGEAACNNNGDEELLCRLGGDFRAMEQPMLASMHTLWVREHNRIVQGLLDAGIGYSLATNESRETLYQAARRILIAEMQVVVYDGFLPAFMDQSIMKEYSLIPGSCSYQKEKNPGVRNEWGISFRLGHTWVSGMVKGKWGEALVDSFFNPTLSYTEGSDPLMAAMAASECPDTDRILEEVLREHLFRDDTAANDLAALNIQRGRDHGVSYCRAREALGLVVPETFNDLVNTGIMTKETVDLMRDCYDCVCDIDLFTGIVSETPLKDRQGDFPGSKSTIGELANHVLAEFFHAAKCGDRYWYEFKKAGFTKNQREAIEKVTLSRILCDNQIGTNITEIQPDSFKVEDSISNPLTDCTNTKKIPSLDLSLFPPPSSIVPPPPPPVVVANQGKQAVQKKGGTSGQSGNAAVEDKNTELTEDGTERNIEVDNEVKELENIEHLLDLLKELDNK